MPNTNKPSRKRTVEEEEQDSSSDDNDSSEEDTPKASTAVFSRPGGGGKQLRPGGGKMLRMPAPEDDDDDDEEEEEEEEDSDESSSNNDHYAVTTHVPRSGAAGGGKQLRMPSGGKQLRVTSQEEDSDEEDSEDSSEEEDEPQQQTKVVASRGGKSLANMRPLPQADEDEEDSDDSSEEEETRLPSRGGGKSLANIQRGGKSLANIIQPSRTTTKADESEDDDETPPPPPRPSGGGKSLLNMQPSRGKQLKLPNNKQQRSSSESSSNDDDEESEASNHAPTRTSSSGGKMFRAAPGGGKMLRLPQKKSPEEEEDEEEEKEPMLSDMEEDNDRKVERKDADSEKDDSMEMSESSSDDEIGAAPWATTATPTSVVKDTKLQDSSSDEISSSDDDEELDVDKMDPSELIKDEEDQKYLLSLPEFEREAILGERFEKLKNERDMKKALKDAKRQERERKEKERAPKPGRQKKSPAGRKKKETIAVAKTAKTKGRGKAAIEKQPNISDEEMEGEEEPIDRRELLSRNRDGAKGKKAAARAAIREVRAKKQEKDEEDGMETSDSDEDFGSSSDDDDEDYARPWDIRDNENESAKRSDTVDKEEEQAKKPHYGIEAVYEDYKTICLPRRRLARWCNEPFFEKAVINSFVRFGLGIHKQTKKQVYLFCKVVGVVPSSQRYAFPKIAGHKKEITTDKLLKVEHGEIKTVKMYMVSDSAPTESEVSIYIHQLKDTRKEVLMKNEIRKIRKNTVETVTNYKYTKDDIDRIVEKKKKVSVARNIGLEKTRIETEVQSAREALTEATERLTELENNFMSGNEEIQKDKIMIAQNDVTEAKKLLDAALAEKQRILEADELRKRKIMTSSKVQNWVKVNQRAKEKNRTADYLSYKDQAKNDQSSKEFDPFARRKVKPDILWEVGQSKDKTDVVETVSDTRDAPIADSTMDAKNGEKENKKKLDFLNSQKELLGKRHQFAIDEEVLARTSRMNGTDITGENNGRRERIRKGLSLAEYQAMKAAGSL